jgi:hypothetical protein
MVGCISIRGGALGLSSPGDKVQMHPDLEQDWAAITQHYRQVGLTFTDDIIWDVSVEGADPPS